VLAGNTQAPAVEVCALLFGRWGAQENVFKYVETQLLERIRPHFRPHAKEGRKLIVAALRSPGSIRLQPGQIRVKLAPQSSPHRTRAVAKLCESLNELKPVYPGTELQIVFENPLD